MGFDKNPEDMLNTTFDWNGKREPMILATENDVLNAFGMDKESADYRACQTYGHLFR